MAGWEADVTGIVLFVVAYAVAAVTGISLRFGDGFIALIWPGAGVMVAAACLAPPRLWLPIFLLAYPIDFAIGSYAGLEFDLISSAAGTTVTVGEGLTAALLVRALRIGRDPVAGLRRLWYFMGFMGVLTTAVWSAVGAWTRTGFDDMSAFREAWQMWWLGDAMGVLFAAVPILSWAAAKEEHRIAEQRPIEAVAALTTVCAVALLTFTPAHQDLPLGGFTPLLLLPPVHWLIVRFPTQYLSTALAIYALALVWSIELGAGPFTSLGLDPITTAQSAQGFMLFLAAGVYSMAALNSDRDREQRRRTKLEENLRGWQKLEAVGTLAAGVGHEFNNHLMAARTYLAVAKKRANDPDRVTEAISGIEASLLDAQQIVGGLLAFAREGHAPSTTCDVADVVYGVEARMTVLLGRKHKLRCKCAQGLWVRGDAGDMAQVLVNLIINARDAMPQGGTIRVDAERTPMTLIALHVTDSGTGMDAETAARVFEPFFTTKPRGSGTGMGLAIAHGTIQRIGGTIEVDTKPGKGTRFTISLPPAESPREASDSDPADVRDPA